MKSLVLLFFLSCLVNTNVFARFIVNSCPKLTPYPFKNVHLSQDDDSLPTCNVAKEFGRVVEQINDFAQNNESIYLTVFYRYSTANYDDGGLIRIPERMVKRDLILNIEHEKSLKSTLVTFAHEYGHSVFANLLKYDFPEYMEFKHKSEKLLSADIFLFQLMEKMGLMVEELEEAKENSWPEIEERITEDLKKTSTKFNRLSTELKVQRDNFLRLNSTKRVIEITTPYHELFADIIAVFYAEDPRAMYLTHTYPNISFENEVKALMRDFSSENYIENWTISEVHGLLAPTRYFLWKNYWPDVLSNESKRVFLKNVYEAILNEISFRFQNNAVLSPKEINLRLINQIKLVF